MIGESGATPARIADLIEGQGNVDVWDVTVMSTFLNGVEGRKWRGEPERLEGDFRRIGELMRRRRRPLAPGSHVGSHIGLLRVCTVAHPTCKSILYICLIVVRL